MYKVVYLKVGRMSVTSAASKGVTREFPPSSVGHVEHTAQQLETDWKQTGKNNAAYLSKRPPEGLPSLFFCRSQLPASSLSRRAPPVRVTDTKDNMAAMMAQPLPRQMGARFETSTKTTTRSTKSTVVPVRAGESRIGKHPVPVPKGVTYTLKDNFLSVKVR